MTLSPLTSPPFLLFLFHPPFLHSLPTPVSMKSTTVVAASAGTILTGLLGISFDSPLT